MKNNPSTSKLLERSLIASFKNLWRNRVLTLTTIFVTATIIFIFNIILAVNFIAQDALNDLNKKIDVIVYIKESSEYPQIQKIINDLERIDGIEEVKYTSKEEALAQLKTSHPDISLAFEKYELGNPLPASLNIKTISPEYHVLIGNFLAQDRYQAYLSNVTTDESGEDSAIISSVSKNLVEVNNFTKKVIFWLIITFILGGALIILNALQITIFSRKKEINIMKLVGASHWFIRSPFIIEAVIYGALAVALSFVMLVVLAQNIAIQGTELWNYYTGINFLTIFLIEAFVTISLSISSSVIAIHEYLRQDLLEE